MNVIVNLIEEELISFSMLVSILPVKAGILLFLKFSKMSSTLIVLFLPLSTVLIPNWIKQDKKIAKFILAEQKTVLIYFAVYVSCYKKVKAEP